METPQERAILVFQPVDKATEDIAEIELERLAETAHLQVVGILSQRRQNNQKRLGKGKVQELKAMAEANAADVVVFNERLSPSEHQAMESALQIKVIDKTILILDIFAARARSREGQLQVELAQLNHLLPRLSGRGIELSRLGGGVGTRGPGETQLETDRRHIRRRISHLEKLLEDVKAHRDVQKKKRMQEHKFQVALVGYTNAGKSSLLNALTEETHVYVEDQLFATLDPTTRKLKLDDDHEVLITDTVGFIQALPPELIKAFRGTLEVLEDTDLILHVVDATSDNATQHVVVVESFLQDLDLAEVERIGVLNKIDELEELPTHVFPAGYHKVVGVSALTGEGLDTLKDIIKEALFIRKETYDIELPIGGQSERLISALYDETEVDKVAYEPKKITITFQALPEVKAMIAAQYQDIWNEG